MNKTKITFIIEISSPICGRTKFRCRHLRRRLLIRKSGHSVPVQLYPYRQFYCRSNIESRKLTKTLSSTESISCELIGVPRLICLLSVRWGLTIFVSGKFSLTDVVVLSSKISPILYRYFSLFHLDREMNCDWCIIYYRCSISSFIDQIYSSLFESLWLRSRYTSLTRKLFDYFKTRICPDSGYSRRPKGYSRKHPMSG